MGKLQIKDEVHQQEDEIDSKNEEESPLDPLHLLTQSGD